MKRVSSRQRLVSWDDFDAAADSDSDSDSNESLFDEFEEDEESYAGYETALSHTYESSIALDRLSEGNIDEIDICNSNSNSYDYDCDYDCDCDCNIDASDKKIASKTDARRRKRDRKSPRFPSIQRTNIFRTVESPSSVFSASMSPKTSTTPTVIPSFSWEHGKPSSWPLQSPSKSPSKSPSQSKSPSIGFSALIDDLHLKVFSFLDLSSLRAAMFVNHHFRQLMVSHDSRSSLWIDHCEKLWNIRELRGETKPNQYPRQQPILKFIDNFHLPLAAPPSVTADSSGEDEADTTNLSLLLSLTANSFPTCVDRHISKPRARLSSAIQQTIPGHRRDEEDQLIRFYQDTLTGRSLVLYTGYVGQGDRCIRSNCPIPRPSRRSCLPDIDINININIDVADCDESSSTPTDRNSARYTTMSLFATDLNRDSHHPFLFNFLRRRSSRSIKIDGGKSSSSSSSSLSSSKRLPSRQSPERTPFVVPFVEKKSTCTRSDSDSDSDSDRHSVTTLNVTPRFVYYFEVSIFKRDESSNNNSNSNNHDAGSSLQPPRPRPRYRTSHVDCVAVGVATKRFQVQSRMPGWDGESFGYHGDDGGIFHSSGAMLSEFGPKFGPGDTVGCGVDYISKGIFYTLNGKFLGYAWKNISDAILEKDLYTVVGLDSNCPVHLNLGFSGSFQFDLSGFIQKHEGIIAATYSLDRCVSPSDNDGAITSANTVGSATSSKRSDRKFSGLSSPRRQRRSIIRRWNHEATQTV